MTKLLEQAMAKARALPEAEQDAIAQVLIDEMDSKSQGDQSTKSTGAKPAVPLSEKLKDVVGKAKGLPQDSSGQKGHYLYGRR